MNRKKKFVPHQFWLENLETGGKLEVDKRICTISKFGTYLLKLSLEANDLRLITRDKVMYVKMWEHYYNGLLLDEELLKQIAVNIVNEQGIYVKTIDHRINSRMRNSITFIIYHTLLTAIEDSQKTKLKNE